MLMQNFMTANQLGIYEVEHKALIAVLGMLEREEIPAERFAMGSSNSCIYGWAKRQSAVALFGRAPPEIYTLFGTNTPALGNVFQEKVLKCRDRTKAAMALRNYLTTGKANWEEVLAC